MPEAHHRKTAIISSNVVKEVLAEETFAREKFLQEGRKGRERLKDDFPIVAAHTFGLSFELESRAVSADLVHSADFCVSCWVSRVIRECLPFVLWCLGPSSCFCSAVTVCLVSCVTLFLSLIYLLLLLPISLFIEPG